MAWIAQSNGAKTYYRTNTVANGLNENDVNILILSIGSQWTIHKDTCNRNSDTIGIYAPLAVANADWDNEATNETLNTVVTTLAKQVYVVLERTNYFWQYGSDTEEDFQAIKLFKKIYPEQMIAIIKCKCRWRICR